MCFVNNLINTVRGLFQKILTNVKAYISLNTERMRQYDIH